MPPKQPAVAATIRSGMSGNTLRLPGISPRRSSLTRRSNDHQEAEASRTRLVEAHLQLVVQADSYHNLLAESYRQQVFREYTNTMECFRLHSCRQGFARGLATPDVCSLDRAPGCGGLIGTGPCHTDPLNTIEEPAGPQVGAGLGETGGVSIPCEPGIKHVASFSVRGLNVLACIVMSLKGCPIMRQQA